VKLTEPQVRALKGVAAGRVGYAWKEGRFRSTQTPPVGRSDVYETLSQFGLIEMCGPGAHRVSWTVILTDFGRTTLAEYEANDD
jgi:hypothetical protein